MKGRNARSAFHVYISCRYITDPDHTPMQRPIKRSRRAHITFCNGWIRRSVKILVPLFRNADSKSNRENRRLTENWFLARKLIIKMCENNISRDRQNTFLANYWYRLVICYNTIDSSEDAIRQKRSFLRKQEWNVYSAFRQRVTTSWFALYVRCVD